MAEAVPALSDRAHGLLRAFAEAAEAGQDAARLAAARAADRPELMDKPPDEQSTLLDLRV